MTIELDEQEALLLLSSLTEYTRSTLPSIARHVPAMREPADILGARAILLRQKIQSALPKQEPK